MRTFDDMLSKQLKDEEFRKEYEAIQPEMDVIRAIVDARTSQNLTQKELAELVGVSQRAIAAYESSGTIARISTMRKLAHALNVSYDYLKHDEITDPSYGIEKMDYIDEVHGQLGEKAARDINNILEANRALFAGGELDEEAKDAFYQAVTKAYLSCKMEAKKTFGRKKKNTEMESDS